MNNKIDNSNFIIDYKLVFATLAFVLLESVSLKLPQPVQLAYTLCVIVTILVAFCANIKIGLVLHCIFTLVSMGELYNISEQFYITYTSYRIFDISANSMLWLIFMCGYLMISFQKIKMNKNIVMLLGIILAIGVCLGVVNIMFHETIFSNFIIDIYFVMICIVICISVSEINKSDALNIIISLYYGILLMYICSFIFGLYRIYGNQVFLRENSVSFYFLPLALFLVLSKMINRCVFVFTIIFYVLCIYFGKIPLMGKQIVINIIFMTIGSLTIFKNQAIYKKIAVVACFCLLFIVILFFQFAVNKLSHYGVYDIALYKLNQMVRLYERGLSLDRGYEAEMGSVGNLIAETFTIIGNNNDHPFYWIFGKGFGGAMHDIYFVLCRFAGTGGYPIDSLYLDSYLKPHFPFLWVLLKFGLVGIIIYMFIFYKLFFSKSIFFYLAGIVFLFRLTMSKEQLLFFVLLIMVEIGYEMKKNNKNNVLVENSTIR